MSCLLDSPLFVSKLTMLDIHHVQFTFFIVWYSPSNENVIVDKFWNSNFMLLTPKTPSLFLIAEPAIQQFPSFSLQKNKLGKIRFILQCVIRFNTNFFDYYKKKTQMWRCVGFLRKVIWIPFSWIKIKFPFTVTNACNLSIHGFFTRSHIFSKEKWRFKCLQRIWSTLILDVFMIVKSRHYYWHILY